MYLLFIYEIIQYIDIILLPYIYCTHTMNCYDSFGGNKTAGYRYRLRCDVDDFKYVIIVPYVAKIVINVGLILRKE